MQVTNVELYRTYQIDIEDGMTTYLVTAAESDFGWDFRVLNVDSCEDVEPGELYSKLVKAACEDAINNPKFY